jgi:hypothetical protein
VTDLDGVRVALFERFAALLRAPTDAELGEAAGIPEAEVPAALRALADQRMVALQPGTGELWMAAPFSAVPTGFVAVVNGRRHFGNCIWDALGVIAMLGGIGRIESTCPDCDEPLAAEAAIRRISAPRDYVVHFSVPAAHWWDDIGFT